MINVRPCCAYMRSYYSLSLPSTVRRPSWLEKESEWDVRSYAQQGETTIIFPNYLGNEASWKKISRNKIVEFYARNTIEFRIPWIRSSCLEFLIQGLAFPYRWIRISLIIYDIHAFFPFPSLQFLSLLHHSLRWKRAERERGLFNHSSQFPSLHLFLSPSIHLFPQGVRLTMK